MKCMFDEMYVMRVYVLYVNQVHDIRHDMYEYVIAYEIMRY